MANEFCSGLDDLSAMLDGKVPPDDVSDALKHSDFSSAAQKLKDNPNARVDVSDLSATKIHRLEDFGVPKSTVERLIKERADFAASKLASEVGDFGRIGEKIRRGEDLTPDEYSKLWNERRDLGLDALEGSMVETSSSRPSPRMLFAMAMMLSSPLPGRFVSILLSA